MIVIKLTDLRKELGNITNTTQDISKHPAMIKMLNAKFPHSIQLVRQADPGKPTNCYEHAFEMDHTVTHAVGQLGLTDMHVGLRFISDFLLPQLTEITQHQAKNGDYILYFDEESVAHAGIITGERINSKWGKGHIYEHKPDEVPACYGSNAQFYTKIPGELATKRFVEYVKSHGDYGAVEELLKESLPSCF